MGYFYFDESKHRKEGFILGAFVYAESDPNRLIIKSIKHCGLTPGVDEFKSGYYMAQNPKQKNLRDELRNIIFSETKIGILIIPCNRISDLCKEANNCLSMIINNNNLRHELHEVYFHRGICPKKEIAENIAKRLGLTKNCKFHYEQDSKKIYGIQLADLTAHTCSTMLLESLGFRKKTVKSGDKLGYDPDLDIEIGFELWAQIRYTFFSSPIFNIDPEPEVLVESYGLYIADSCDKNLKQTVIERFGKIYVGCIHS